MRERELREDREERELRESFETKSESLFVFDISMIPTVEPSMFLSCVVEGVCLSVLFGDAVDVGGSAVSRVPTEVSSVGGWLG